MSIDYCLLDIKKMFSNKLQKIIEYSLYTLAFLLPFQTRLILREGSLNGGYFEYGTISVYGVDIVVVFLIFLFVFYRVKNKKNIQCSILNNPGKVWYMLAGLELFIFISIFFASDKLVAIYKYVLFLMSVGLFFVLKEACYSKFKLILVLIFGAVIQAFLALWQFFAQQAFACKWLGLAEHYPYELGQSVIETVAGGRWLRAYGAFDHPNVLGGVLVVVFLLMFIEFLIFNNQFSIFNFKKKFNQEIVKFFIFYFFILILILGVFFSFSRAAWLALSIGLAVILILSFIKKQKPKEAFKIVMIITVFFLMLTGIFKELVFTRFSTQARLEQKSYEQRVESLALSKEVIKHNLFFGVGIGNYTQYVHDNINSDLNSWDYQPVHNVFLLVLAEIGLFGFMFFLLFIYMIFKDTPWQGVFTGVFVLMMFDHWFWSLHFGMVFLFFVLGISNFSFNIHENINKERC